MDSLRIPGRVLQLFGLASVPVSLMYGLVQSTRSTLIEGALIIVLGLTGAALICGIGGALVALDTIVSHSRRSAAALEHLMESRQRPHQASGQAPPRLRELSKDEET